MSETIGKLAVCCLPSGESMYPAAGAPIVTYKLAICIECEPFSGWSVLSFTFYSYGEALRCGLQWCEDFPTEVTSFRTIKIVDGVQVEYTSQHVATPRD